MSRIAWVPEDTGGSTVDANDKEMLFYDEDLETITGTPKITREDDGEIYHTGTPQYKTDAIEYRRPDALEAPPFGSVTRASFFSDESIGAGLDIVGFTSALLDATAGALKTSFKLDVNAHAFYLNGGATPAHGSRVISVEGFYDGTDITFGTPNDLTPSNAIDATITMTITDGGGGDIYFNGSSGGSDDTTRWHGQYQITIIEQSLP